MKALLALRAGINVARGLHYHAYCPFLAPRSQNVLTIRITKMLKQVRHDANLSQEAIATRAAVPGSTVVCMEPLAKGDMSVSARVRLLGAAG